MVHFVILSGDWEYRAIFDEGFNWDKPIGWCCKCFRWKWKASLPIKQLFCDDRWSDSNLKWATIIELLKISKCVSKKALILFRMIKKGGVKNYYCSQVTAGTSPRRDEVINITNSYALKHPEVLVHLSNKNKLQPYEWQRLLQISKFTICPGGHNPETFRMFEALETGWGIQNVLLKMKMTFHVL